MRGVVHPLRMCAAARSGTRQKPANRLEPLITNDWFGMAAMTGRRKQAGGTARKRRVTYAAEQSVGHQIRWTHRALQRALEARIRPYGITLGMWYFLRVLWEEDGPNQRALSER